MWWPQGTWTAYLVVEGANLRAGTSKRENELPLITYPQNLHSMVSPTFRWFQESQAHIDTRGKIYSSFEGEGKGYKDIVVFCIPMISTKNFCFGMQS